MLVKLLSFVKEKRGSHKFKYFNSNFVNFPVAHLVLIQFTCLCILKSTS